MMNRSKLFAAAAAAALSCALLASCGSSASSTSSQAASSEAPSSTALSSVSSVLPDDGTNGSDALTAAVDTLLESNPISNQFEITAMNIEYDFGLKAEDVASVMGRKRNKNRMVLKTNASASFRLLYKRKPLRRADARQLP